jgi:hypothetical protein
MMQSAPRFLPWEMFPLVFLRRRGVPATVVRKEGGIHPRQMQVGFPDNLAVRIDARLHKWLHFVLDAPDGFVVDRTVECGMFTSEVGGHRSDTHQLDPVGDSLPAGLEITGGAGHLEVVDVHH